MSTYAYTRLLSVRALEHGVGVVVSIKFGQRRLDHGSVVRSRGCSACCARTVYWNVNYFGVIRTIAMARAVVGHRERAVPVACWPSTIYGCSYELLIGLTTSLKTIDGDCW